MHSTHKRNLLSGTGLLLAAGLAVASVILVNASLTTWRLDLTENKLFTLSEGTIRILQGLEEPLTLDFYFSQRRLLDYPRLANYGVRVRDMLEEYATWADGKIVLNVLDPEPFSELEEQAVAAGMQGLGAAHEERAWFGLVGSNSTDDEKIIPFFDVRREREVEYDITKLIHSLALPDQRVIGVISKLPVFADKRNNGNEWVIISALREFFVVRELGENLKHIDPDLDALLLIHPKELSDEEYYALDQYLLRDGRAMIFIDPLAEQDTSQAPQRDSMVMPKLDSYLKVLLSAWGLEMEQEKLVADLNAAMRVQTRGATGPQEVDFLPWLRLTGEHMNGQDFSTSGLNIVHLGTMGHLKLTEDQGLRATPLLQTSTEAMLLPRDLILVQPDHRVILNNFKSANRKFTMAVRLQGTAKTAYPEGPPIGEAGQPDDSEFVREGPLHVIVVADTDILADHFWTRPQTVMGRSVHRPVADNDDFVINSLEHLTGGSDLATLRTRDKYSRPFLRVEALRKESEARFRAREQALQDTLRETEENLRALQLASSTEGGYIFSPEQAEEIEKFRGVRLETRKALRAVRHELQKNIDRLGARVRFVNIFLVPLLITLAALLTGLLRSLARRARTPS